MNKFASAAFVLLAPMLVAQEPPSPQPPSPESTSPKAQKGHWYADFDEAVMAAKKADKDLLVDFTGSDWCGWCIKLHDEVFEHDEFKDGVEAHFVLVALDFPNDPKIKAKVPNPERNAELQAKYKIQGFPTILLVNGDGEVFGRMGYQAGGPVKYVESLDKMRTEGKRNLADAKDLVGKFESSKGATRDAVVGLAIEKLAGLGAQDIGVEMLAPIVLVGVESADAAVQFKAVEALLKSGQADESCFAKVGELDPKNEKGLHDHVAMSRMGAVRDDTTAKAFLAELDSLIELGAKDAALFEAMLSNAAGWSFGPLKDKPGAVKYAKILKEKAKNPEQHAKLFEAILGK